MKIIDCEQGSVEWQQARAGIPTASEFGALITPTGEIRKGAMPQSYLAKKIAEWWQGGPILAFNAFDMEQGRILEEEAVPWYESLYDVTINRVGFITTDDGRIGCSPDGLLQDGGIEIKCPKVETHTGYLLDGGLPDDYLPQVHGSMFVTGLAKWTFLSYRRRFPAHILTVERDDKIQRNIAEALGAFLLKFDAAKKRLEEINGAPRPERKVYAPSANPQPEQEGIVP